MRFSPRTIFYAGLFCSMAIAASARATTVTFDFNSLTNGASNNTIKNYMNGALQDAGYAGMLTGVSGAVGSNSYTGDNHAVGPKSYTRHGSRVTPLTLGNTDNCTNADSSCSPNGSNDTFIKNNAPGSDRISLSFSGLSVDSISFDLEIFPDGSCTAASRYKCGGTGYPNWPDFKLYINGQFYNTWLGAEPGDDDTYADSPAMKSGETAPQLLTTSGLIDLGGIAVTSIEFVDWPATIGIDNLALAYTPPSHDLPPPVPAPPALSLFLVGLAGLGFSRRRRRAAR